MGVKLTITIEGPITDDDRTVLTGATMVLMGLVGENTPDEEPAVEEEPPPAPSDDIDPGFTPLAEEVATCSAIGAAGSVCQGVVGHRGRHLFRSVPQPPEGLH